MNGSEYRAFDFAADDGLTLCGRDYGPAASERHPVICLPGLSRNSRDFHQVAMRLTREGRRVIAVDYRGRGLSDWDDNKANYNIVREAQDVIALLDAFAIDQAVFIGTSRGGLILHVLGGMAPQRIVGLVFNDIGPVIEAAGLKRIRDYLSIRPLLATFADAALHLRSIHGDEFPALSDTDWREMAEAIYTEREGTMVADFDPALLEPLLAADLDKPLPDMWLQFDSLCDKSLLVIRGENSKLLSPATVSNMLQRHTKARSVVAHGQGHTPLLHAEEIYGPLQHFLGEL